MGPHFAGLLQTDQVGRYFEKKLGKTVETETDHILKVNNKTVL